MKWIVVGGLMMASLAASEIEVRHRARSLQPGEAVLLVVDAPTVPHQVTGQALEQELLFFVEDGRWIALLGIDLETKPGTHPIELQLTLEPNLPPQRVTYPLEVKAKKFPTRRLNVDSRFVDPPPEALERIREESALLKKIYSDSSPRRLWKGSFIRPVAAAANSSFGKRSIFNGKPRSPHSGTDFDAAPGTPVESPNAGRVALARDLYFSGNTVILDHGLGLFSVFAHLSAFKVEESQSVSPGEVLGLVGATGRVTGPHLHWSVKLQGARVDPLSLLEISADADQ